MSAYIGSWKIDDLLTFVCNTQVFSTGVATDADAVPSYRVYEDETTTPILTGTMALIDGSNTAGFYSEQITLSAANGFEKGKSYSVYITATVSGVAGTTNRTFQIEAEVDANTVSGAVPSVTGAVGSVTGAVGSVTGLTASNLDATISSRATPAQILTTVLTESYAADGAAATLSQLLYEINAFLQERAVVGTTVTVKKLDGSTTAMTFTINDATTPTAITRAT